MISFTDSSVCVAAMEALKKGVTKVGRNFGRIGYSSLRHMAREYREAAA